MCVGSNLAKILFVSSCSQRDCLLGSHNTSVDYEMPFDLVIILILYKLIVIVTRHKLTILKHDCNTVITQCHNIIIIVITQFLKIK